jgi:predicted dehydrogenase
VLLRFAGGARGMLWVSQVAPGHDNGLRLRVYGEKAGLLWIQALPEQLVWSPFGEPPRVLSRGGAGTGPHAARVTRIPAGHPEGYLEAFATLYAEIAAAIRARGNPGRDVVFPDIGDGVRGLAFVDAAVRSSARGARWTKVG